MDQIIIRSLQGTATEAEEKRLRTWRRAAKENEIRYREVTRLWELTEAARAPAAGRRPPSADEIIEFANADRADDQPATRVPKTRQSDTWTTLRRATAAMSAAALVLLGLGLGKFVLNDGSAPTFGATEVMTGPLEKATVQLNDGSVVRLAPDSRVRVTAEAGDRELWLDGRAYFSVVDQDGTAFRVNTRGGSAHVLGTRFAVDVRADTLNLIVEEGSVALGSGGSEVEVRAGQMSRATGGSNPTVTRPIMAEADLRWAEGFMAFQATPLTRVVDEIAERYDIEVRILDDGLEDETVTAWFTDQSADQVLDSVCRIIGAHCTVYDGIATIEP